MSEKYDKKLRKKFVECGKNVGVTVHEGVHVGRYGPTYQTPAEVVAFSNLGASTVGMSMVPEAIVSV